MARATLARQRRKIEARRHRRAACRRIKKWPDCDWGDGAVVVFNSLTFAVFFACVLVLHRLPFSWTAKKINLLIASYLFYAAWNPPFVILLWVSTVVDWWAAKALVSAQRPAARRGWMLLSVVANLGMLGFFKYGQFLLDNFTALMSMLGVV